MPLLTRPVLKIDRAQFEKKKDFEKVRDNLSALGIQGDNLWLGGDEGTRIDRMTREPGGDFSAHRRFELAELLDLPDRGPKPSEIDIEGISFDSGYLWIIGSHSLKRGKPDAGETDAVNFARIAEVKSDGNRFTLGRLPIDANGEPAGRHGPLTAARLEGDARRDVLFDALRADPLIGPFCAISSKDNGLDIEGLAVAGNRIWAGLRGPVLRGWAVVVEFDVRDTAAGRMTITGPLRKHLLDLEGLGVRDLAIHGNDIYVLSGPTMNLDGPASVFRWKNALSQTGDSIVFRDALIKALEVPFGRGCDHAEGLALMPDSGAIAHAMICYDSPNTLPPRLTADGQVCADIFALEG